MQTVLWPYVVYIDDVKEEGEAPVGYYWEEEREVDVRDKGEERREGPERVGGERWEVGYGGHIRGECDVGRHGCRCRVVVLQCYDSAVIVLLTKESR